MDESQPSSARGRPRRSIGDEWESNGVKYKIGSNGQRLRQTLVKKERQKFHMPEDSQHPDRQANLEVYVESWLTEEEYREAKEQQLLAWQDSSNKPSVEPQTPTIESQEDLSSANGKSLLWKSMSASANPETSTPQQITTPPVTPQPTQPLFGSSVASTLGLRINPLGNVPPAGKRISSAIRRPSAMRSDGTTTVPPSPTGSVAHGLADSTNNNPCHKAFSKWEKQDLEAKAMMKMREANRLKEEERLHKLKKEQEAAAPPKIVPTITVTKADDAKPAETKPAGLFCAPPTPAAADAPKKGAPNPSNPLFGPPKAATQPPSFTLPTSQPAFKPPTIPAPTSTLGGASTKPTGSLFGSKPNPLNSFVSFGPPSSSTPTPSAAAPSAPVASANPDIPTSKLSFSFGPLPGALAQPSQAHATPKTTFGTPQPPAQSQPTPAETTSVPKFSFGFPKFPNKSTGGTPAALPSSSSSLTGALGSEAAQSAASPFSFSKPSTSAEKGNAAPANVPAAPTANDNAPSAPKFSFGMPSSSSSSSGSNSFAVKGPPSTTATSGTTAAQSSFGGFGAKPAGESSSTSVPAPSAFGFGSKPATNGPSAPAAQSVFGAQSTAGSSSTAGSAPAFGLGAKPAATSSSTSVPAPSAFGFGSKPVTNGPSAPAAQSVFGAQSTAGSSSTAGSAPAFGFGAKPAASSSSTSAPAQSAFDASSTTTPAPSFGGFGAQPTSSTTGPAQSTFGSSGAFSAKPDTSSAPAPASSAFSFGATNVAVASGAAPSPFGASNNVFGGGAFGASVTPSAPPGAAAKNGAPASKPVFSFGTPSSMTPTGTPSAIPAPAAPAAAPSAFGTSSAFGSSASNATPALGTFSFGDAAKNTAPATNSLFGKPADPSAFGFGAGNAFSTFGKSPTGQQQQ
ncbi:hypothetical protein C0991_007874 [Blastosporella zonata]|nr:hypothetical protein C0991_007874 [Blastosporella zonata]